MAQDVVDVIVEDHRRIEELVSRLTSTVEPSDQRRALEELASFLAAHSHAEEAVIYPVVRAELAGGTEAVSGSTYEHLRIAGSLERLRTTPRDGLDLVAACRNLALGLRFHIAEEEDGWLAVMGRSLDLSRRQELAEQFIAAKRSSLATDSTSNEIDLSRSTDPEHGHEQVRPDAQLPFVL